MFELRETGDRDILQARGKRKGFPGPLRATRSPPEPIRTVKKNGFCLLRIHVYSFFFASTFFPNFLQIPQTTDFVIPRFTTLACKDCSSSPYRSLQLVVGTGQFGKSRNDKIGCCGGLEEKLGKMWKQKK